MLLFEWQNLLLHRHCVLDFLFRNLEDFVNRHRDQSVKTVRVHRLQQVEQLHAVVRVRGEVDLQHFQGRISDQHVEDAADFRT